MQLEERLSCTHKYVRAVVAKFKCNHVPLSTETAEALFFLCTYKIHEEGGKNRGGGRKPEAILAMHSCLLECVFPHIVKQNVAPAGISCCSLYGKKKKKKMPIGVGEHV